MMDMQEPFIILDVRSEEEYRMQRIDGAVLIPVGELKARAESELPDKDAQILVYCASGARSATAVRILTKRGYTNVHNIGAITNWPYGIVRG